MQQRAWTVFLGIFPVTVTVISCVYMEFLQIANRETMYSQLYLYIYLYFLISALSDICYTVWLQVCDLTGKFIKSYVLAFKTVISKFWSDVQSNYLD